MAWDIVCLPMPQGGLGIRNMELWNISLMAMHVRNILINKNSLCRWIHTYRLKGRSFWKILPRNIDTFGWKKILSIRLTIRDKCWFELGNGRRVSIWFDNWCDFGSLDGFIRMRDISRYGLKTDAKVADLIDANGWKWPDWWHDKYPILLLIPCPFFMIQKKTRWFAYQRNKLKLTSQLRIYGNQFVWKG